MKKLCIATATRAEFGLLLPVIKKLKAIENIDCQVVATGTHLSMEFGMTINDIVSAGVEVNREIDILMGSDSSASISKTMGIALISFADYFKETRPDALLVLGDRYEILAICCAAMNERIPIIHMYGGDKTEGAIDETIRHMITKMSYLHFTATEAYRKRVIQLGEDPERVFFVGSTGIENVLKTNFFTKEEIERELGINLGRHYAVATFHPVTLEENTEEQQITALLDAVCMWNDINFLFTKANADVGGRKINALIENYSKKVSNLFFVDSLGMRRYLSAVKNADFVIGNSSSGIVEAPALGVPSINIGDRQKGRLKSAAVIDCEPMVESICEAIRKVKAADFKNNLQKFDLYGDGNSSQRIANLVAEFLLAGTNNMKKHFFDISFDF